MWGTSMRPLRNFVFPLIYNLATLHLATSKTTTNSMAIPSVQQLDQPEPLHQVMAQDKPEDCLPCRVTGECTCYGFLMSASNECFQAPRPSLAWAHTAISQGIPS